MPGRLQDCVKREADKKENDIAREALRGKQRASRKEKKKKKKKKRIQYVLRRRGGLDVKPGELE